MEIPYAVVPRPDTGLNNARLGLWLFLASEVMLFGALISAYVFLRTGAPEGLFVRSLSDIPLPAINTLILLTSTATMTLAVRLAREGSLGGLRGFLGVTMLLGLLFLGIKWISYAHAFSQGQYPSTNTYQAIHFTLTGVHALHVGGGIVAMAHLWITAGRLYREDPARMRSRASTTAVYWNFVDGVWIVLFMLLYVI